MKNSLDTSHLSREVHDIPDYVCAALDSSHLWERYRARPPYQQNDYIGWISHGKRKETRQKRLAQMLAELRGGSRYMGMAYHETAID
ncbi:MAG: YdeI/OmpD-associated family protein [Treponematales bacterium]